MISRIRFPAEWRDDNARQHIRIADFKLGLGPCGKAVISLDACYEGNGRFLVITQTTADFEEKIFAYPVHTILGRIEITQGND